MIPALQPSRPKPPQQSPLPTYAQQQQRRATHETSHTQQQPTNLQPFKPTSQIEAMPPFGPPQTPPSFFTPLYDSAVRHPVFFTQTLKKPPFPIPHGASQGWNPVASGYIVERRRGEVVAGKTKL
ncbi:hypothetical protein BDW02DRAFT_565328 [Decorospora gaudefroyi]|uniref:Uncharacterized protein n=1 Tax=Decorospora gaudefroyi TaxID=184978 RepID=A0A6A5KI96_9PLEO|nr:hypothetical protein BDW02DRAFT_565328 [Decorospora gaudefroyi]